MINKSNECFQTFGHPLYSYLKLKVLHLKSSQKLSHLMSLNYSVLSRPFIKYSELLASDKLHTICIKRLSRVCKLQDGFVRRHKQTNSLIFTSSSLILIYFSNQFVLIYANLIRCFPGVRLSVSPGTGSYSRAVLAEESSYWYWCCISTDFNEPN